MTTDRGPIHAPTALALVAVGGIIAGLTYWGLMIATDPAPSSTPVSVNEDAPVIPDSPGESVLPTPTLEPLPPCPTEDSTGCYWDGDSMGNGDGEDIVSQPGEEPVTEPSSGGSIPADNPDPGYTLETWPHTIGDTIVCGHNARPAIDYREDVGYWAYCEEALVP
jgi:hypothetical protein